MSNNNRQAFNSEGFKAQQRQISDNAAAGWQAWWQTIERGAQLSFREAYSMFHN